MSTSKNTSQIILFLTRQAASKWRRKLEKSKIYFSIRGRNPCGNIYEPKKLIETLRSIIERVRSVWIVQKLSSELLI